MTTGVLSWAAMKSALNLNTGFFETSQYTLNDQMAITSGNHDGAGASFGNLQYNYGPADRAQELFYHLVINHETVVRNAFGANTTEADEFINVTKTYTRANRITWADGITDFSDGEGRALLEPWKTSFANLLLTQESKDKYFAMSDAYYLPNALDLFKMLNCKSRAALASIFDININRGRFYSCNTLVVDFENIDADDVTYPTEFDKEAEKIRIINTRGNDTTNAMGDSAQWFVQRRECQAEQGGDYYGNLYDPEVQFDINQETAIAEKVSNLNIKLGEITINDLYLGTTPIKSIYLGANFLGGNAEPYVSNKAPQTQFRTNDNSYLGIGSATSVDLEEGQPLWIDVQNFVAAKTYYTIDGSTPTTASAVYHENLTFTESCTLKTLTVNVTSGVAEAVKTLTVNIPVSAAGYRYVRFQGYGDNTGITTRLVEYKALQGSTNYLAGKSPISGEAPSGGGAITKVTDGIVSYTSGEYPYWWTGEGVPNLIYDMGASYAIDTLFIAMYSPSADPRQVQFKLFVSEDNVTWTLIADYENNTTVQPPEGWSFTI